MNRYHGLAIILLSCFVIVAILATTNYENGMIKIKDTNAFLVVNKSHFPPLNGFMILLADYGRELVWALTMILLFLFGGITGKKTAIVIFIIFIALVPSVLIAKDVIHRPRPSDIQGADYLIKPESEYSYPSGHATIVSAGAATMLALFGSSSRKLAISIGLAVEAFLVCISVVYVGVHYPLDVVGGILFGVGISFIFIGFVKYIERFVGKLTRLARWRK